MQLLGHLLKTIFRAFFRIVFSGLFFAVLGGGITLLVAFGFTHHWPPDLLTIVATIAIGVLSGLVAGIGVLMREAVQALLSAASDVVNEVEGKS
jgi:hypothetical protein